MVIGRAAVQQLELGGKADGSSLRAGPCMHHACPAASIYRRSCVVAEPVDASGMRGCTACIVACEMVVAGVSPLFSIGRSVMTSQHACMPLLAAGVVSSIGGCVLHAP